MPECLPGHLPQSRLPPCTTRRPGPQRKRDPGGGGWLPPSRPARIIRAAHMRHRVFPVPDHGAVWIVKPRPWKYWERACVVYILQFYSGILAKNFLEVRKSCRSAKRIQTNLYTFHKVHWVLPWWLRRQSVCLQCGRPEFDRWVGRCPGEGNENALQYPCLENPMNRGAWEAIVHGVTDSRVRLSDLPHSNDKNIWRTFVQMCMLN